MDGRDCGRSSPCACYREQGVSADRRRWTGGVEFDKTIHIQAPVEEVFSYWAITKIFPFYVPFQRGQESGRRQISLGRRGTRRRKSGGSGRSPLFGRGTEGVAVHTEGSKPHDRPEG